MSKKKSAIAIALFLVSSATWFWAGYRSAWATTTCGGMLDTCTGALTEAVGELIECNAYYCMCASLQGIYPEGCP